MRPTYNHQIFAVSFQFLIKLLGRMHSCPEFLVVVPPSSLRSGLTLATKCVYNTLSCTGAASMLSFATKLPRLTFLRMHVLLKSGILRWLSKLKARQAYGLWYYASVQLQHCTALLRSQIAPACGMVVVCASCRTRWQRCRNAPVRSCRKKCRGNYAAHFKLLTNVWHRNSAVQRVLQAILKTALGILHSSAFPTVM